MDSVTAVIGFSAIGVHNLVKQPDVTSETVTIPSPLAADVDAALLQHKPVLMEFYIDGCQSLSGSRTDNLRHREGV